MPCVYCERCVCGKGGGDTGGLRMPFFDDLRFLYNLSEDDLLSSQTLNLETPADLAVGAAAADEEQHVDTQHLDAAVKTLTSLQMRKRGRKTKNDEPTQFLPRKLYKKHDTNTSEILLEFFRDNITWPYPKAGQLTELMMCTGLSRTQVLNWFVNWRKRHWSAAFGDVVPLNKEAVEEFIVAKYGNVKKGTQALISM